MIPQHKIHFSNHYIRDSKSHEQAFYAKKLEEKYHAKHKVNGNSRGDFISTDTANKIVNK